MNTETERERARSRQPAAPRNAIPTAIPDAAIDSFATLSVAEIEAEIARRRAAGIESRIAQRDRLIVELHAIEREIATLERDLRSNDRKPLGLNRGRSPTTPTVATVRNESAESTPVAPAGRAVRIGSVAGSTSTIRLPGPTPAADVFPPSPDQATDDPTARTCENADRAQPAPVARPPSLSQLVLAVIVETRPQSIALREIVTRVRARLDRERSDLDRAVPQVIRELRASGVIEATGFEEYTATEAGVRRLQG